MLFLLTTAAGAALWAADLEAERRHQEAMADQTQAYSDEAGAEHV